MPIQFDEKTQIIHLSSANTSYVIKIYPSGFIGQLYWGKRLRNANLQHLVGLVDRRLPAAVDQIDFAGSLDLCPQEYPAYGTSDFRVPAVQAQLADGSTITDLRYQSHRIVAGKPRLEGLPATYTEAGDQTQTLEITLLDRLSGLEALLSYSMFVEHDALARSVRLRNTGSGNIKLLRVLSMGIDLYGNDFSELHLSGSWGRERNVKHSPLLTGSHLIDSARGISSHQHNPFMALLRPGAGEDSGEVFGFNLVYSGNFLIQAETDQFDWTRVVMGINPFDFSWLLEPGQSFQSPEAIMVHSDQGLGLMSRRFHRLYRQRLVRGQWKDRERPILINNWEGTYFDFNADKIEAIAAAAAPLGIELFVLDDGWFGHRDQDNCSLGDWVTDTKKLPQGLGDLAGRINRLGMKFGLWFEPEMVSPDSDLYRAHPDWCLHVKGRQRTEMRNQLVLDMSRREVCDHLIGMLMAVLESTPIAYVKWDMNRSLTEIGSAGLPPERQRETAHRYLLGVYYMMETITSRFPQILFEGCSAGGARFDPGILHYMPQIWTSDNSDAISRLKIQYGTSLVYPPSVMGAHVSASPNHQVGRLTSLEIRGDVAMSGVFGYELDTTTFSESDKALVAAQVKLCKETRHLVLRGDYFRLKSPWEGNFSAWMLVAPDQSEAMVTWVRILADTIAPIYHLQLKGLDPAANYRISGPESECVVGGDLLMEAGLRIPNVHGDFKSFMWRLKRV